MNDLIYLEQINNHLVTNQNDAVFISYIGQTHLFGCAFRQQSSQETPQKEYLICAHHINAPRLINLSRGIPRHPLFYEVSAWPKALTKKNIYIYILYFNILLKIQMSIP